ncbi:Putative diheme cytochrome c-553 [Labilithrix luteola]|uniref:Putative diheme cytochrome c-553 n=1 Tax=Labilithrix luteola TaxID=1391654 RepID=A0A0K1PP75_9BACT|nr:Putative diheme cytochrome c-553 [Labilithrix luteola]
MDQAPRKDELVKRGGELVKLGGCNDCHTPLAFDPKIGMPMPRTDRTLSGHPEGASEPTGQSANGEAVMGATMTAYKLPFGTVYAANLTPDLETGLGSWTEQDFIRAMRTGKHQGKADGRPILPPMPWMNLSATPEADLRAMFAFLRSIPAVKNSVPVPNVPPQALAGIAESYAKMAPPAAAPAPSRL